MSDYTLDNSAYERLERENARLKAERDLAVRVAYECMDVEVAAMAEIATGYNPLRGNDLTTDDIRKVLAWYRETKNAEKGGE